MASKRLPGLDGIRAVAVLMVIAHHTQVAVAGQQSGVWRYGAFGVFIFFVLSGFLITSLLLEEEKAQGHFQLKPFYARRFLRIQPPALFYLAVVSMLGLAGFVRLTLHDVVSSVFIYNNFGASSVAVAHFWSLSIEEQFYIVWPFLLLVLGHLRRRLIFAALLIILEPLWRYYCVLNGGIPWSRTDITCDALVVGCALALIRSHTPGIKLLQMPIFQSKAFTVACVVLGCLSVTGLSATGLTHYGLLTNLHLFIFERTASYIFVAMLINQAVEGRGWFLNIPPLVWLGRISYSLYLWQELVLLNTNGIWGAVFRLSIAFAIAVGSYYFIEQPCNRLRQRFAMKATPEPVPLSKVAIE